MSDIEHDDVRVRVLTAFTLAYYARDLNGLAEKYPGRPSRPVGGDELARYKAGVK